MDGERDARGEGGKERMEGNECGMEGGSKEGRGIVILKYLRDVT